MGFYSQIVQATEEPHQVVVFAINGLMGKKTTGRAMPLLHDFTNKGVWTMQMRATLSNKHPKIGWIPSFYGLSPIAYGCDEEAGCENVPPMVYDPLNYIDVLGETLQYQINIFSETPEYLGTIIGDNYNINKFNSKKDDLLTQVHLSSFGNRFVLFHWNEIERTGASDGWASSNYNGQVDCLDYQIYTLALALWEYSPNRTTFVMLSDRGGHNFGHKQFVLDTVQTPLAMWGYGITKNVNLFDAIVDPIQLPITLLTAIDANATDDVPSYWNTEVIPRVVQTNESLMLRLGDIHVRTIDTPPQCDIPNTVEHHDLQVTIVIVFIFMLIFAIQLSSVRIP